MPQEITNMKNLAQHIAEIERELDKVFLMPSEWKPTPDELVYDLDNRKNEIKSFLHSSTLRTLAWVKELIVEESNIARSENQPTSRLTSLYMKITGEVEDITSDKVEVTQLECLECGQPVTVKINGLEMQGVFNVFCHDKDCEDKYAAKL